MSTTLDKRMVQQRIPGLPPPTARVLDAPACWRVVLANDALFPDAGKNRNAYLAKQAARRWLSQQQRAEEWLAEAKAAEKKT